MVQQEIRTTSKRTTKAAYSANMKPIWDFQKPKKQNKQTYNTSTYKENGAETKDATQTMQRWTQWIQTHFPQTTKGHQNIQIEHIKETWGQMGQKSKTPHIQEHRAKYSQK